MTAPDPAKGANDTPPNPLVGWGGVKPCPDIPLNAFGVSLRRLWRLSPRCTPPKTIFWIRP